MVKGLEASFSMIRDAGRNSPRCGDTGATSGPASFVADGAGMRVRRCPLAAFSGVQSAHRRAALPDVVEIFDERHGQLVHGVLVEVGAHGEFVAFGYGRDVLAHHALEQGAGDATLAEPVLLATSSMIFRRRKPYEVDVLGDFGEEPICAGPDLRWRQAAHP